MTKQFTINTTKPAWAMDEALSFSSIPLAAQRAFKAYAYDTIMSYLNDEMTANTPPKADDPFVNLEHEGNYYWVRSNGDVARYSWQDGHSWAWSYYNAASGRAVNDQAGDPDCLLWEV